MATSKPIREKQTINAGDIGELDPGMAQGVGPGAQMVDEDFDIEAGWTDEQVGFPPYWKPHAGRKFKATFVGTDSRDPDFVRHVLRATHALACQRGPAENAEFVAVKAGQFFTMSAYKALPIERFLGYEVIVIAEELREGVTKSGNDVWHFRLLTTDETKVLMKANEVNAGIERAL